MNLKEIKDLIENNAGAFATVTEENKPNVIGVAFVKVVDDDKVLITDNYMSQTIKDIIANKNVCLIVWDEKFKGCKLIGEAEYYAEGEWKDFVSKMKENEGLPAKGAILIKVSKVLQLK